MGFSQALQYVARGWSVVPIPRGEKHPMIQWDHYKTSRATVEEVKAWVYNEGEDSNVGIITGAISGLVVVDADGPSAIAELERRGIRSPLCVRTSKGLHLYFAHPGVEVKNAVRIAGSKEEGIDIRGDGGLVVAPPSVHASGRIYQWMGNPMAALPVYNPAWFGGAAAPRNEPGWMGAALLELGAGNRNATFAKLAGKLYREGWKADAIYAMLSAHADRVAFPLDELQIVVQSVGRYHPTQPTGTMSMAEILAYDKEVEWIVPGVFPKQGTCIIGGPPKIGKTWALLDLGIAIAGGVNWMGTFPVKQGSVLYIDEESAPQLLKYRLRKLLSGKKGMLPGNLPIKFRVGKGLNFSDPESRGQLVRELREDTPAVIIIDSLVRVHRAAENSADEMKLVFAEVKKIVDEFGLTVIFADHVSKQALSSDPKDQHDPTSADLRGSNEKGAFCDSILNIYKKDGGLIVHHTASRWTEAMSPFSLTIRDEDLHTTLVKAERYDV